MDKDKIINLIEQELVQADQTSNHHDFEKHMYTIHTLTSLFLTSDDGKHNSINGSSESIRKVSEKPQRQEISAAEIKAMGGTVASNYSTTKSNEQSNLMVTDDEIGNGESIFDF